MIDVMQIIASIEADKKARHVEPSFALMSEISHAVMSLVRAEINQAVSEGRIGWHETINTKGFETLKT